MEEGLSVLVRDFGLAESDVTLHRGVMGVPISFLDKYCPEQFEIAGITKPWAEGRCKIYPEQVEVGRDGSRKCVTKLNDGAALRHDAPPRGTTYYLVDGVPYTQLYARILVKKRGETASGRRASGGGAQGA